MALGLAGDFSYEYRQSLYDAPVQEHFRFDWGRLRLREVRSPSVPALEYFRWPTAIRRSGDSFVIDAPGIIEDELVIRVAAGARQSIRTRPGYRLELEDFTGADVVRVRGAWRPLAVWARAYYWSD